MMVGENLRFGAPFTVNQRIDFRGRRGIGDIEQRDLDSLVPGTTGESEIR